VITLKRSLLFLFLSFLLTPSTKGQIVRTGADVLLSDSLQLVRNVRLGVVCNKASVLSDGMHLLDALLQTDAVRVTALYSPEHGFDVMEAAGQPVSDHTYKGLPLYSLYGQTRKPTAKMLADVDVLVFDLQDAGSRWYTYLSTLAYCIEAASEKDIPILVLDRPNPLGGELIEGPSLSADRLSFIGALPIPIRHGMTFGELARMLVGERWLHFSHPPQLHVLPMGNWKRSMYFEQTGLTWIPPSPNIPTVETALAYAGLCLVEGTNVSEGRGTPSPFLLFGAPFYDAHLLAVKLNAQNIPGVHFTAAEFTPTLSSGLKQKFFEEKCSGVRMFIDDRRLFRPVACGLTVCEILRELGGDKFRIMPYFEKLLGVPEVRAQLRSGKSLRLLSASSDKESAAFGLQRTKYLLYK
jgi:uncharacterized protein YbbC (DUF1343 family)